MQGGLCCKCSKTLLEQTVPVRLAITTPKPEDKPPFLRF